MGGAPPNSGKRERTRLEDPVLTVLPYGLLAVLVAVTVAIKHTAVLSLLVDLGLCALAAGWMAWMFSLHPNWRTRPSIMVVFLAGLLTITAVLVVRDPWFGCFTPAAYLYTFRLLPWPWLMVGVATVAAVAGTAQASDVDKTTTSGLLTYLAVLLVNVVPMCGLAWFTWRRQKYDDEREQALADLSQANRRLEVALVENGALYQWMLTQARGAGVLDERQRMAGEIHDTLAQGLTGIITQLQAAEQSAPDSDGWRRHVAAATGLARESLVEARRSVHALHPESLRTSRLRDALADVAAHWSGLYGINAAVTTTGTARPLSPAAEAALLRTAQEALANIAKHAGASRVGLTLSYMDSEVALDVRDDGRGFDPAELPNNRARRAAFARSRDGRPPTTVLVGDAILNHRPPSRDLNEIDRGNTGDDTTTAANSTRPGDNSHPRNDPTSGGFGLTAMRARIEKLAGRLQVESELGVGTAISASLPVAERKRADGQ